MKVDSFAGAALGLSCGPLARDILYLRHLRHLWKILLSCERVAA